MRTTLSIDDDALQIAKNLARSKRVSLGHAVSELVRQGANQPVKTSERNGLTIVQLPPDSPPVSAEDIEALLEEIP